MSETVKGFNVELYKDAAGMVGFGAYCMGHMCASRLPAD